RHHVPPTGGPEKKRTWACSRPRRSPPLTPARIRRPRLTQPWAECGTGSLPVPHSIRIRLPQDGRSLPAVQGRTRCWPARTRDSAPPFPAPVSPNLVVRATSLSAPARLFRPRLAVPVVALAPLPPPTIHARVVAWFLPGSGSTAES